MKPNISRRSTGLLASRSLERRVPLRGRIDNQIASCCIARLLVLATEAPQTPIIAYIESPGGSAADSLGIISSMSGIRTPVVTFCRGAIGGTAAVIAAHGLNGYRAADPDCRFSMKLMEEPSRAGILASSKSFLHLLAAILAKDVGKPEAEVLQWLKHGAEYSPEEALRNGLIDAIARQPVWPSPI